MATLTADQVLALAPDPASAKAGQGLAQPRKWVMVGGNEQAIWGECQGSGKSPYQTRVDLAGMATKCSCPSRKFPCKHALGLMLACAADVTKFASGTPPPWVAEWLQARGEKAEKAAAKVTESPADPAAAAAEAEKRSRQRHDRVSDGLAVMDQWIKDLVRGGLAQAQGELESTWRHRAARLVDAQATGAARRVENLSGLSRTGAGWHDKLLEEVSLLYLLSSAYGSLGSLSDPLQADVRRHLGWTMKQEEVIANPGLLVADEWLVLGQVVEKEDRLTTQRTWLRGARSRQDALVLSFAVAGQALEARLIPGQPFAGELAFYPSNSPLRALIKDQRNSLATPIAADLATSLPEALASYAHALAHDPWLEAFPLVLAKVTSDQIDGRWFVRDVEGGVLPMAVNFVGAWKLHALLGGHPAIVAGEWNGRTFLPLSSWAEGRYANLS